MRIYTDKIHKAHSNLERLEKYFYKSQHETTIFSEEGIFKVKDGAITKTNITDGEVQVKKNYVDNITFFVDSSYYKNESYIGQIPYDHSIVKQKNMHYRLQDNAVITLCVELLNNNIHNYYFITKENIDNFLIKKDIVTFLSLLK
jgi:hypothetical protein